MDGMYAALHIVYHSNSIIEGLQKAVSYGGDADSIASVVGQILGAAYGLDRSVISLYLEKMYQYDQLQTLLKAYLLFNEQGIETNLKYVEDKQEKWASFRGGPDQIPSALHPDAEGVN